MRNDIPAPCRPGEHTQAPLPASGQLSDPIDHLKWALEMTGVGTWLNELPLGRLNWDAQTRKLFFVAPDIEPTIDLFWSRLHPDDREPTRLAVEQAIRDHNLYSIDHRAVNPDTGEIRWIRSAGRATYAPDGTAIGFDGVNYDITERKHTEEALQIKDSAMASSLNAIAISDLDGHLTYINAAFLKLWGSHDERRALGRSVLDFWKEPELARTVVEAVRLTGGWTGELAAARNDGAHLDLYLSASLVRSDKGDPICMMASFLDITERKKAEQAIQQYQERIDKKLEAMTVLQRLGTLSAQERELNAVLLEIVDAAIAVAGADFGDIQLLQNDNLIIVAQRGFPDWWIDYWNGEGAGKGTCHAAMKRRERVIVEDLEESPIFAGSPALQIQRKAGVRAVQSTPLVSRSGIPIGMFSTHYRQKHRPDDDIMVFLDLLARQAADIIERVQAEAALLRERNLLASVMRTTDVMLVFLDMHFNFVWVNDAYARTCRMRPEEMVGRNHFELYPDAANEAIFRHVRDTGQEVFYKDKRFVFPDQPRRGTTYWDWSLTPSRDAAGNITGLVFSLRETTRYKLADDALRKSEDRLRHMNETLDQQVRQRTAELALMNRQLKSRAEQLSRLASELTLTEQRERHRLAKVLHDHLQQLLVAAKVGLQGLSECAADDEQKSLFGDIRDVINESIAVSRSLTVELSPSILHEAGLSAGLQWLARWMQEKHGLVVDLHCPPDVVAEREDIRILLFESVRELLFNVAKHAGVTTAKVELSRRDTSLRLVVSDRGVGFDPEHVRAAGADAASGFGLFTIRERLELLGGSMTVEGGPRCGSRFTLVAPAVYPETPAKPETEEDRPVPSAKPSQPSAAGPKLRILMVDDHSILRQAMVVRLKREPDMEVAGEAANGEEAVEKARQLTPDVILMDFSMPRMDGVEATTRIHAELPHIRIVGLSMYEEADRAQAMLHAGAAAYVTKTANLSALMNAIRGTN